MDGTLSYVAPNDLQSVWHLVSKGLHKVKEFCTESWIPEDVYHALKTGASTLHLAYRESDYVGFVVLSVLPDYDGKRVHIWCAYGEGGGCSDTFMPQVVDMAKNIGAKRVTFWSPREWDHKLGKMGFAATQTEWKKEL